MQDAKGRPLSEVYRLMVDEGRLPFTHPAQHLASAPMAKSGGHVAGGPRRPGI